MHMYRWIESHVVKYVNIVQVKKKKKGQIGTKSLYVSSFPF